MSTTKELLKSAGLNWSVKEEKIFTESNVEIPEFKAIVRTDKNIPLSVMGKDYGVYQNEELMNALFQVSKKSGLEIHSGGCFDDGAKVYIQLKSDDLKLNGDTIKGYLTGINSFDGTTSLAFGPSNLTISCKNTFYATFRNMKTKVRHTKNLNIKVEEILSSLETSLKEEKEMFDNIKMLADTKLTPKAQDAVIRSLFDIPKQVDYKNTDDLSTVTANRLSNFYIDLKGELKGKGDNLWGLFSGVTKYTTHTMAVDKKGNLKDTTKQKMFGLAGNRERKIFNDLVELV